MDQHEHERLEKAHQSAQLLLSDLREIHNKTGSVAIEELMVDTIRQIANISRLLVRLTQGT
jgi:virulence-associated protein VapD